MENLRECKRCLTREMAGGEDIFKTVREYIEQMDPEKKAEEGLYEQRLNICKNCERLLAGMCRACGCYVEIRAAKKNESCPYKLW